MKALLRPFSERQPRMAKPTVFVIDDDPRTREVVEKLVHSVGLRVEHFNSAQDFLRAYSGSRPGCLVVELRMPGANALALQQQLAADGRDIPVIILTSHGEVPVAVEAMKNGAFDFIEKPAYSQQLLDCIQGAIAHDAHVRREQEKRAAVQGRVNTLTAREHEVLGMVLDGWSSKEIAAELDISYKTVEVHRHHVLEKMQAESGGQLMRMLLKDAPGAASAREAGSTPSARISQMQLSWMA